MKERYIKPNIIFESFSLTQMIASCGAAHTSTVGGPTHDDEYSCAWDAGDGYYIFFTEIDNSQCVDGPENEEDDTFEFSIGCYNNPDGGNSLFGS